MPCLDIGFKGNCCQVLLEGMTSNVHSTGILRLVFGFGKTDNASVYRFQETGTTLEQHFAGHLKNLVVFSHEACREDFSDVSAAVDG